MSTQYEVEELNEYAEQIATGDMDSLDWMQLTFLVENHVEAPDCGLDYPHADRVLAVILKHHPDKFDEVVAELDSKVAAYVRRRRRQIESYATRLTSLPRQSA